MERLILFWHKYRPRVDPSALLYLKGICAIEDHQRGTILKLPDQPLPYLCIVLDGVVGGFESQAIIGSVTDEDTGMLKLRELILPMDYFSGPAHLFTLRNRSIEYQALSHVSVLRIPLAHARDGQQRYPDLAELFQVMKQRKINQLRKQVAIYQERDHYRRYCLYRQLLPDWTYTLSRDIQCQFLRMSKTHFHRVKAAYLRRRF